MEAHEGASGVVHLPNTGGLPGMSRMILTPVLENSPRNSPLNVRKAVAYSAESAERVRMENQATSIDEVEIGRALGSGNFGEVFYGMWRKPQGVDIEIALKKLHRPDKFENFRDEASTLRQLQHSNIVRYYGVFVDHNRHDMYLATEYMKSGSLIDVLQNTKRHHPNRLLQPHYVRCISWLSIKYSLTYPGPASLPAAVLLPNVNRFRLRNP